MAPPRKRAATDTPDLDSDDEGPASKRNKVSKSDKDFKSAKQKTSIGSRIDQGDEPSWSLNDAGTRCINISEFKGMTMVGVREFYEKDGKMLPGKKGISLKAEQFAALVELLPEIEIALAEKMVKLPRPSYDGKTVTDGDEEMAEDDNDSKGKDKGAEDEENENESTDEKAGGKKRNFEATSDEEE
ncbi:MAG: hypothetical protein M1831_001184 [Alyxoria varia]|nr:MAG: hypothetical protein M1831_001184 [Alyxoria varia]